MSSLTPQFPWSEAELQQHVRRAVLHYWVARGSQATKQQEGGTRDAGSRGEVTGGKHLDEFLALLVEVVRKSGFTDADLRFRTGVELPGYYRPTKKWDLVVIRGGRLCAAIEMKSQVGPSFGNNVNNRSEEAVGSSVDLWLAYREGTVGIHQPWLGYFFFLEEAPGSTRPVSLPKGAFTPDPVFEGTSYADRYRILCERMVRERNYNAAALLLSPRGADGLYTEPQPELSFERFARSLYGHLVGCL